MFTGMVEELGRLLDRRDHRVRIGASVVTEDIHIGDSIAVNGCCLTVVAHTHDWWEADVSDETLGRTTLGRLPIGSPVNLERSVRLEDRLGGHLVQGHVDGVGAVLAPAPDLVVSLPEGLGRYVVEKGSIAVDGVSLTVVEAHDDRFAVAIIPHTATVTNLGSLVPGDPVDLEVDVTVKYVERLLAWTGAR